MKALFDRVSSGCSTLTTKAYSTSFSLGIRLLSAGIRQPIYGIYGFVRLADEIVDSFHGYDQAHLLADFRLQTYRAIDDGISLNPILNSFQQVVNRYNIPVELIETFLESMEMDLDGRAYTKELYDRYILGSAEVVGLMCLRVFTGGDDAVYERLKLPAMRLGAAFQKVNFLRDAGADFHTLGRTYFPGVNLEGFSAIEKAQIEEDIASDFDAALVGIEQLPRSARMGVYLAYLYYKVLFEKIKRLSPQHVLTSRVRLANAHKMLIMCHALIRRRPAASVKLNYAANNK
ncbi:phytoene/squalene synthase family protein [Pedobacter sp. SYP-B3415]|uniref:phytoene/squalene synthase family protein n=1 Tax=Pedobacter sp. SYP-B3415 TaxID=2496641 RepID=UPI00101CC5C2|nr:phytoene/squalene synthase family protein [Pedobacter sp. SYP-B3415]